VNALRRANITENFMGSLTAIDSLIPIGIIALIVGGIALLVVGARQRVRVAAGRIDLIRPRNLPGPGRPLWRGVAPQAAFARAAEPGMPVEEWREVARRLSHLGVPPQYWTAAYAGVCGSSAALLGLLALTLCGHVNAFSNSRALPLLIACTLGGLGWYLPRVILRRMVRKHARAAAAGLPDALELLVVCVEAGLSLEDGIDRIVGELKRTQPALAAELTLTSADLKILPSRDQALEGLATRLDIPIVQSVVSTLSQTFRYGTPLAQAMRVAAAEVRAQAIIDLEERASRLPAIMTVPMMLFIMPTIFLIVGGPAVLHLLDMMHHG
jgi:tight adherence protein C